jgi:Tol biopolymer transport system component
MRTRFRLLTIFLFIFIIGLVIVLGGCQWYEERYIPMHSPTAETKIFAITATSEPTMDLAITFPTFTNTPASEPQPPTATPQIVKPTLPHATPTTPHLPVIEPRTRIAYVSSVDGNREVYLVDWDRSGAGQIYRLTEDPAEDTLPSLSPDGWTVAFVSDRSGNREIYLADLWTGARYRLTHDLADDSNPTWSPDGTKIAFQSDRDGNKEIYIIDVSCAERSDGCPEQVVRITNNKTDDLEPSWSPDGERIAFMSASEGNLEIFVMNVDGYGFRRMTYNSGVDGFPSWSPDGSMLAYHSERQENTDIYIVTLEKRKEIRITTNPGDDMAPYWCGDSIVYMASFQDSTFDIYLIHVSSEGPQSDPFLLDLTATAAFDGFPTCIISPR